MDPRTGAPRRIRLALGSVLLLLLAAVPALAAERVFLTPEAFIRQAFDGDPPPPKVLWLSGERRKIATRILGHPPPRLRVRYWLKGQRSAWILEEIGKEMPITVGIVIDGGRVAQVRVLIYRESRGHEVRHPFFVNQFEGATLDDKLRLDRRIDGISGATLSVRALKRLVRLALWLHGEVSR